VLAGGRRGRAAQRDGRRAVLVAAAVAVSVTAAVDVLAGGSRVPSWGERRLCGRPRGGRRRQDIGVGGYGRVACSPLTAATDVVRVGNRRIVAASAAAAPVAELAGRGASAVKGGAAAWRAAARRRPPP